MISNSDFRNSASSGVFSDIFLGTINTHTSSHILLRIGVLSQFTKYGGCTKAYYGASHLICSWAYKICWVYSIGASGQEQQSLLCNKKNCFHLYTRAFSAWKGKGIIPQEQGIRSTLHRIWGTATTRMFSSSGSKELQCC